MPFFRILALHQCLHHIRVDLLAPLLPVAGHGLSLVLVGDGEVKADEDGFAFTDFTVDDVVLVCGFIELGDDTDLVSHAEFVFLHIAVDILDDRRGDIVSEEGESVIALFCDFVAGGVVSGFQPDQPRLF